MFCAAPAAAAHLSLPERTAVPGSQVEIPVAIDNAAGTVSYRVVIYFDPAKLSYVPASATGAGTLTAGFASPPTVNTLTPGRVVISSAGSSALGAGGGTLVKFAFALDAAASADLELVLDPSLSRLNDGALSTTVDDGTIVPNFPPTVSILNPATDESLSPGVTSRAFSGIAGDADGTVASVQWRLGSGGFQNAAGTASWSFTASGLQSGPNVVEVRALDDDGDPSQIATRTLTVETVQSAPEVAVTDNGSSIVDGGGPVSFGSATQGGSALAKTFRVTNSGSAALTTSGLSVPSGYSVTEGLSSSIAAGAFDDLTVSLSTANVGTFSGTVQFANNDADENPFNFTVSGTINAPLVPEVAVTDNGSNVADGGGPVSFGSATQGGSALAKTFRVTNSGTAALTTSGLSVPSGYSVTESLSSSIAAGTFDDFTVSLSTANVGTFSGTVQFANNDADENPFNFTVTGMIAAPLAPEVAVTDNGSNVADGGGPVSFGSATQGGSALAKTFRVTNSGTAALTTSGLSVPSGYSVTEGLSSSIAADAFDDFSVSLSTANVGIFGGTIQFGNNDSSENPFNFTVSGTVTAPVPGGSDMWAIVGSPPPPGPVRIEAASPADGEGGVSLSRETVIDFTRAIAPQTVDDIAIFAEFGGKRVPARLEVTRDGRTVSLFYQRHLPASARIRVTILGDLLLDPAGVPVDADDDGEPGGTATIDFDTLALAVVPGTSVVGRVFASELEVAKNGIGRQTVNRPLQGARIFVDGAEDAIYTTTDAMGNFRLENPPAGEFFVYIDGRAVTTDPDGNPTLYPAGPYYPFVGKKWTSRPGEEVSIPDIYLPLVRPGTLKVVSNTQDTTITFPPSILQEFPEFAGVHITVPAGSLFSDNGARGGSVGIAPVPPDRIPEPLPPGLNLPLVITVQTNDPTNFDVPVPVCFPNVDNPETPEDERLLPGEKSALWSFDHDIGSWVVMGPMTAGADGNGDGFADTVCSDDGVGIREPGWHGAAPGTNLAPPSPPQKSCKNAKADCGLAIGSAVFDLVDCGLGFLPLGGCVLDVVMTTRSTVRECMFSLLSSDGTWTDCAVSAAMNYGATAIGCVADKRNIPLVGTILNAASCAYSGYEDYKDISENCLSECAEDASRVPAPPSRPSVPPRPLPADSRTEFARSATERGRAPDSAEGVGSRGPASQTAQQRLDFLGETLSTSLEAFEAHHRMSLEFFGNEAWLVAVKESEAAQLFESISAFAAPSSESGRIYSSAEIATLKTLQRPSSISSAMIDTFCQRFNNTIQQSPSVNRIDGVAYAEAFKDMDEALDHLRSLGVSDPMEPWLRFVDGELNRSQANYLGWHDGQQRNTALYWRLADHSSDGASTQRGVTNALGVPPSIIVGPRRFFLFSFYDPLAEEIAHVPFISRENGDPTPVGQMVFAPVSPEDDDNDGISDDAEVVIGTSSTDPDSDDDGIPDGAEIDNGTDPLDGFIARTGIVATAPTSGSATDIVALNDIAVTAEGQAGITVFNVFSGLNPIRVAQIDTPGSARAVALSESRVAVADDQGGLVVVDISDPPAAFVSVQIPAAALGGRATSVAVAGTLAAVGTSHGSVVLCDMLTGTILDRRQGLGGEVHDMVFGNEVLWVLVPGTLRSLDYTLAGMPVKGSVASSGGTGAGGRRLRLAIGGGLAWATHTAGYNVFNVANPASPSLARANGTQQFGWRQIVPNGSGLGFAAVGPNSTSDGPHDVSLYDISNPQVAGVFLTEFPTPGLAEAVSIYNGLGYVADGPSGMQVVNYLSYDSNGIPPTIALSASFALSPPSAEEGKLVRVTATVSDDVQVRAVDFFVDGERILSDGNFPFEARFVTPLLADQDSFLLKAVATDTGGNEAETPTIEVTLVEDATPPQVRDILPKHATDSTKTALLRTVPAVSVFFSEAMNPATLNATSIRIVEAGVDRTLGTADDVVVSGGTFAWRANANAIDRIAPGDSWLPGIYRVTVQAPAADPAGNPLAASRIRNFVVYRDAPDADGDCLPDIVEVVMGGNPNGTGDMDNDGVKNCEEISLGFDPTSSDSDGDGIRDDAEDRDFDSLSDVAELRAGSNWDSPDGDGDGFSDPDEIAMGTNPNSAASRPPRVSLSPVVSSLNINQQAAGGQATSFAVSPAVELINLRPSPETSARMAVSPVVESINILPQSRFQTSPVVEYTNQ